MNKSSYTNILVIKNRAMGDAIIGLSTIQYIKKIHPNAKITYIVPKWIAPLFKETEIAADEVIGMNFNTISDWWNNFFLIKKIKPDCIFEMFQAGRTKKFFSLYSKINFIPYYFHNHHVKSGPVYDQGKIKSNIQRDLDGAWTFFSQGEIPNHLDYEPKMKLGVDNKEQIILGVVATRETKMWPLEYYTELSKLLDYKIVIPLSKSSTDQKIKEKLIELGTQANFVEKSLGELPRELNGSKLYIGNDTGIKHLSIALGIPTFTLFGPEPPLEWHPYDTEKHPFYFREGLECRTRVSHYCGLSTCEEMICLNQYKPEQLLETLSKKGMI